MTGEPTPVQGDEHHQRALSMSRAPAQAPVEVPGYETEKLLGRGAFGEVWIATHRNTGVRVAIKFFTQRGGLDWSLLTREVEKLRFLSNDRNVVKLLEVGWDAQPPYYVMEYVEQGSLEDRLQGGPLPVNEALRLFRETAIGLGHAHNKGILHCDLKPANILLDQYQRPRLADFGQSRLTSEHSPALGTWFYMAPEQADFNAIPDVRWDVYALGAVLYALLTGEAPHRSSAAVDQIRAQSRLEDKMRCYRQMIGDAGPLTQHRQRPGVDRHLADIVDRCLAVDPQRRYRNVQAVLNALDERAMQRTRRPILVLGMLGPALAMLAIFALGWFPLHGTIIQAADDIRANELRETHGLAVYNGDLIAQHLQRHQDRLEKEAANPRFVALVEAASREPDFAAPARQELQNYITDMHLRHANEIHADFWLVDDAEGRELANSPLARSRSGINGRYRFRDYFHGQGRDYAADDPRVATLGPVRQPHRSVVYLSKNRDGGDIYSVAYSVPIGPKDKPVGVLATTIGLGDLHQESFNKNLFGVLVDMRPGPGGRRGLILQHPELVRLHHAGAPPADMLHFLAPDQVELIDRIRAAKQNRDPNLEEMSVIEDYRDPMAARSADFDGVWMAAIDPITIDGTDTGWVLILQGREADTLGWVEPVMHKLGRGLLWRGAIGVTLVILVVTALSSYVVRTLYRSSRAEELHSPGPNDAAPETTSQPGHLGQSSVAHRSSAP